MKKLQLFITAMLMLTIATSCRQMRHTIIATNTNGVNIKLEYTGNIYLNADKSGIKGISSGGYFSFNNNGDKIYAESGPNGTIIYTLNDGDKTTVLNNDGKMLLAQAIKMIPKDQQKQ